MSRKDPMKTDQHSGVDHDKVLSLEDAQTILSAAWDGMVETDTHLTVRRFVHDGPPKTEHEADGIVIIARGEAAQLLSDFTPTIPSFRPSDETGD